MRKLLCIGLTGCAALAIMAAPASANPPQPDAQYQQINLDDLKLDKNELRGRKVAVHAVIQVMGEVALLKSGPMDMTPLFLDVSKLPRDARKKLLSDCTMTCGATVNGRVGEVMMQVGVIAEAAAFD